MKPFLCASLLLIVLSLGCSPAAAPSPTVPQPSPTPGHIQAGAWLLPDGQYLFVEVSSQIESTVVEGKPKTEANTDMLTYDFDAATGTLKSRAGFMPPHDAKVIVGVRRAVRGATGSGSSSVLNAYTALPAGDGALVRVIGVDSDGAARMEVGKETFILLAQQSKAFSQDETQTVSGGKIKLATKTRVTNLGVQALSKIVVMP